MIIKSEQEMMELGRSFADKVKNGGVIELIGDVGVGKTTFVRGLAEGLGVEGQVNSPSFTISRSYALPNGNSLVHYDFYRLQDPGIMSEDLIENLMNRKNIVVIEWGESIAGFLPEDRIKVSINYNNDNSRTVV